METQQTTDTTAAPVAPSLPDGADDASLDARASALLEQITTDQRQTARETPADAPAPAAQAKPEPTEAPAAKTPEQLVTERRERIEARQVEAQRFVEEERARVAASRAKKQERTPEAPAPQGGVAITDAASFFAAAEKLAIPPQELAAWLTGQNDPSKAAKHAAKEALSPVEQKLAELEQKQAAWEESQRQAAEQAQTAQIIEQNYRLLADRLEAVKAEAPLASTFATKSPARFRRAVESICDGLPPGFTAQDVIDQLEEDLSDLQLNGSGAATAATSTAKPTPKPAAAQANVGNRLAAERATTVEDDGDDAEVDLDERARRLKARLTAG